MIFRQQFESPFPGLNIYYSPDWDNNAGERNPLSFLRDNAYDDFSNNSSRDILPPFPVENPPASLEKAFKTDEEVISSIQASETWREDNHFPYGNHINLETWIKLHGSGEGRSVQFGNDHITLDEDK
jgi:hypothetical protein